MVEGGLMDGAAGDVFQSGRRGIPASATCHRTARLRTGPAWQPACSEVVSLGSNCAPVPATCFRALWLLARSWPSTLSMEFFGSDPFQIPASAKKTIVIHHAARTESWKSDIWLVLAGPVLWTNLCGRHRGQASCRSRAAPPWMGPARATFQGGSAPGALVPLAPGGVFWSW